MKVSRIGVIVTLAVTENITRTFNLGNVAMVERSYLESEPGSAVVLVYPNGWSRVEHFKNDDDGDAFYKECTDAMKGMPTEPPSHPS